MPSLYHALIESFIKELYCILTNWNSLIIYLETDEGRESDEAFSCLGAGAHLEAQGGLRHLYQVFVWHCLFKGTLHCSSWFCPVNVLSKDVKHTRNQLEKDQEKLFW